MSAVNPPLLIAVQRVEGGGGRAFPGHFEYNGIEVFSVAPQKQSAAVAVRSASICGLNFLSFASKATELHGMPCCGW